jgi:hypothetical protein
MPGPLFLALLPHFGQSAPHRLLRLGGRYLATDRRTNLLLALSSEAPTKAINPPNLRTQATPDLPVRCSSVVDVTGSSPSAHLKMKDATTAIWG